MKYDFLIKLNAFVRIKSGFYAFNNKNENQHRKIVHVVHMYACMH